MGLQVKWIDGEREPQCAPNPEYPFGIDIDVSDGATRTCMVALPYPASRCGAYLVECPVCGYRGGCTTAGRHDDPRSLTVPCKLATAVQ